MTEAPERARRLIAVAREAIVRAERPEPRFEWEEQWLREVGASFVTLRLDGDLRGCIGSVDPRRSLGDDVAHNAFAAAYRDPRFAPVAPEERDFLAVEVSVLGERRPIEARTEDEALAALRPGIDGLYFEYGELRATFLPQVWENIPDPLGFLSELRRKAGLPARFWHEHVRLSRYAVVRYK